MDTEMKAFKGDRVQTFSFTGTQPVVTPDAAEVSDEKLRQLRAFPSYASYEANRSMIEAEDSKAGFETPPVWPKRRRVSDRNIKAVE